MLLPTNAGKRYKGLAQIGRSNLNNQRQKITKTTMTKNM
jgi:hypothetical protein